MKLHKRSKYRVIYADPPWPEYGGGKIKRGADRHYPFIWSIPISRSSGDFRRRNKHPEFKERAIWDVFQEERGSLMGLRGPFDGLVEKAVRASTTCLIMADQNRYSVDARAV